MVHARTSGCRPSTHACMHAVVSPSICHLRLCTSQRRSPVPFLAWDSRKTLPRPCAAMACALQYRSDKSRKPGGAAYRT